MFRHGAISDYFLANDKLNPEADLNTRDTYFMIFGPDQQDDIGPLTQVIKNHHGVILYQSSQSINFGYDDKPRNTLVVFEFNEVPL